MIGRQISFFFTLFDENTFINEINRKGDFIINDKNQKWELNNPSSLNDNFQAWIKTKKSKVFKERNGFLDTNKSDIIEYSRSVTEAFKISCFPKLKDTITPENLNILKSGRLWIAMRFLNEEKKDFIEKEKWLKDWYGSYAKWIKENCRLSKDKSYYIAEDAYKAYKEGRIIMKSNPKYIVNWD